MWRSYLCGASWRSYWDSVRRWYGKFWWTGFVWSLLECDWCSVCGRVNIHLMAAYFFSFWTNSVVPLSQQAIFLAVLTSFSASPISLSHLQDAGQWVATVIAAKQDVDWLRDCSVAGYLCASGCFVKHSPQFSADPPHALPEWGSSGRLCSCQSVATGASFVAPPTTCCVLYAGGGLV